MDLTWIYNASMLPSFESELLEVKGPRRTLNVDPCDLVLFSTQ